VGWCGHLNWWPGRMEGLQVWLWVVMGETKTSDNCRIVKAGLLTERRIWPLRSHVYRLIILLETCGQRHSHGSFRIVKAGLLTERSVWPLRSHVYRKLILLETYGHGHSLVLPGGFALGRPARTKNKVNQVGLESSLHNKWSPGFSLERLDMAGIEACQINSSLHWSLC
jgi:hypothetical protein